MASKSSASAVDVAIFAVERRSLYTSLASICLSKWTELQNCADPIECIVTSIVEVCSQVKSTRPPESNAKDLLVCSMCKCIFFEAITVACGHTFCRPCIGGNPSFSCPVCGFYSTHAFYHLNVVVNKCIDIAHPHEKEKRRIRCNGNAFMSSQQFQKAVDEYSTGLKLDEDDFLLLGNRALALLSLANFKAALDDAKRASELKPFWPKGFYRMALAQKSLHQLPEAALNQFIALCIDPNIQQARRELQQVLKMYFAQENFKGILCKLSDEGKTFLKLFQSDKFLFLCKLRDEDISEKFDALLSKKTGVASKRKRDVSLSVDDGSSFMIARKRSRSFAKDIAHKGVRPAPENLYPSLFSIDDFECCLCFQLLLEPVTPPCGHSFCRHCLARCLDYTPQCPLCKKTLVEYLAQRRSACTDVMVRIMQLCWPQECVTRRQQHQQEEVSSLPGPVGESFNELPVFVCTLALPGVPCPLHVFEPRYRLMMRRCVENETRRFGMTIGTEGPEPFIEIGTVLLIRNIEYLPDGRSFVDTIGMRRFKVRNRSMRDSYHTAAVDLIRDEPLSLDKRAALLSQCNLFYQSVKSWFDALHMRPQVLAQIVENYGPIPTFEGHDSFSSPDGPVFLWWVIAIFLRSPYQQLELLKSRNVEERMRSIMTVFSNVLRAERS